MDMSLPVIDGWDGDRATEIRPDDLGHPDHRADRPCHGERPYPRARRRMRRLRDQADRVRQTAGEDRETRESGREVDADAFPAPGTPPRVPKPPPPLPPHSPAHAGCCGISFCAFRAPRISGSIRFFGVALSRWAWKFYTHRLTRSGHWFLMAVTLLMGLSIVPSLDVQMFVPLVYVLALWVVTVARSSL